MKPSPTHIPIRPDWLATCVEDPLDAAIPVVDTHHHLYDRPGVRYLFEDFLRDLQCGHNVRATVFVQARAMLKANAAPLYQPIGETEFANGVAAMSASGLYGAARVCAGIVGFADLTQGDHIRPVLEQHMARAGGTPADGGRFCGIRQSLTWDTDADLLNPAYPTQKDTMDTPAFRAGFAHLAALGLHFEAWVFFHQLSWLAALARAFPDTPIALNHCGGIVGIAAYANQRDAVFRRWRQGLIELSRYPNVVVKLSGLGMRLGGFDFHTRPHAPGSAVLAQAWRPWIDTCLDVFGPHRCMIGSNFPVDKGSYGYAIWLNAMQRLMAGASAQDKHDVFWRTAQKRYRLTDVNLPSG